MSKGKQKIALTSLLQDDEDERTLTSMASSVFSAAVAEVTNPDDGKSPFADYQLVVVDPAEITGETIRESLANLGLTVHALDGAAVVREVLDERRIHALVLVVDDDPSWAAMLLRALAGKHPDTRRVVWMIHPDENVARELRELGAHDVVTRDIPLPWGLALAAMASDPGAMPAFTPDPVVLLKAAVDLHRRHAMPRAGDSGRLEAMQAELEAAKDAAKQAQDKALEESKEIARLKGDVEKLKEAGRKVQSDLAEANARLKKGSGVLAEKDAEIARLKDELAKKQKELDAGELVSMREELSHVRAQFHTAEEMLELKRNDLDEKERLTSELNAALESAKEAKTELQNRLISMTSEQQAIQARCAELEARLAAITEAHEAMDKASAASTWLKKFEPAVADVLDFAEGVLASGVKVPKLASAVDDLKRLVALLKTLE